MKHLRLLAKADRRVRLGHAWIFSNEVDIAATPLASFEPGDLAELIDARRSPIGIVYVNPRALICARVMSRDVRATIDARWFAARIRRALDLREHVFVEPFYRLLYGESDGTPGIVLDRYGDVCVAQLNTAGALALREPFVQALHDVLGPRGVLVRNSG
ncbi:MAG: RlmI/RlmK family 23S rRNA methyltransferase, partial [Vulcanimicrobiaceae bacterium]